MGTGDFQESAAALAELRSQLEVGRVAMGLNRTQLAGRAGLGRTTVSQALSDTASAPSADTIGALANALRLDARSLLDLLATAVGARPPQQSSNVVGRPITDWDPLDLEVHPAVQVPSRQSEERPGSRVGQLRWTALPAYVRRGHDDGLATVVDDAARGHSRMVVLVGSSSTGKTRACWEAVQPLAATGWRLWHPFDPTRAEAALADIERVGPRTVLWLNEAHHYLGAIGGLGERIAAALRSLLTTPERGPVLVLGTLWPNYATAYTDLPRPGVQDPHPQVRELLAGRQITLPESFDSTAIADARSFAAAGDPQLAHALDHMRDGRLAQFLAGAPQLLYRYETASPPARALLTAAMDARRLGVGLHLPLAFLEHAAADYLTDDEYDALTDDWLEQALADATQTVHGNLAPLRRVRPRTTQTIAPLGSTVQPPLSRLADYLEQHGRKTRRLLCPPASFWEAAHHHLTHLDDLTSLARAAQERHRTYWAHHLYLKAGDAGSTNALTELAWIWDEAGDEEGAERLLRQAAEAGDTTALVDLARMREDAGDEEGAERLLQQAAEAGDNTALTRLAWRREDAGDQQSAERLARQAAKAGSNALAQLARMRGQAGDRQAEVRLLQEAADAGDDIALMQLAELHEEVGDRQAAERFLQQSADSGYFPALAQLARMRVKAGNGEGAERLLQEAADGGSAFAMAQLAELSEQAGDWARAEHLARQAADVGHEHALTWIAGMRREAGDLRGAERLLLEAPDGGSAFVLAELAKLREEAGDQDSAEQLARQATEAEDTDILVFLAWMREGSGDQQSTERLLRQAADAGHATGTWWDISRVTERLWPHGLDPDGTPSRPW